VGGQVTISVMDKRPREL